MIFNILFFIAAYLFAGFVFQCLFAFVCALTDSTFSSELVEPAMTAVCIIVWPGVLLAMVLWILAVLPSRVVESIYTKVYFWHKNKK